MKTSLAVAAAALLLCACPPPIQLVVDAGPVSTNDAGAVIAPDAGPIADSGVAQPRDAGNSPDAGADAGAGSDGSVSDAGWTFTFEFQERFLRQTLPTNLTAAVAVAAGTIVVGTPMGLSRTDDTGATWRTFTVKDGLIDNNVTFLSTNGTEVDVTMGSTGGGTVARFTLATNTLGAHPALAALGQKPLYAMFSGTCEYVLTSVDGNLQHAAWKRCASGAYQKLFEFTATNFFAPNFAVDGTTIAFAWLDWPQNALHLLVSIDDGATFKAALTPEPRTGYDLRGLAIRGKTLYATLSESRPTCTVFASPDAGADFACASPNAVGFVNQTSVIDDQLMISGNMGLVRMTPATGAVQASGGVNSISLSHAKLGAGFLSAATQGIDVIDSQLAVTTTLKNSLLNRNFQVLSLAASANTVYVGTTLGWVELDTAANTATSYTVSGAIDGRLRFEDNVYDLEVSHGKLYVASTDITVIDPANRARPKKLSGSSATYRQTYALRAHAESVYASGNWGFAKIDPATDTLMVVSNDATKSLRHFEFLNNRLIFDTLTELFISDDFGASKLPVDLASFCSGNIDTLTVWQGTAILVCQRRAYSSTDGENWAAMNAPCTKPDRVSAVHASGGNLFWACAEGMRMQTADGGTTLLALPRSLPSIEADFTVLPVGTRWYFGAAQDGLLSATYH